MRRPSGRTRRRRLLVTLFTLLGCTALVLALAQFNSEANGTEQLMAFAGTLFGLFSLGAAVYELLPPAAPPRDAGEVADDLANQVHAQWMEEAHSRRLWEPRLIPLSWAATDRPVAVPPDTVLDSQARRAGRILRLSLDGRLEGDFSTAATRLAEGYRQIPSRRLVVLGEPGAGKTVLALMLTLGLLEERTPRTPVPVLLSVSSWDPVSQSLDDWITATLATQYYGGQPHSPRLLLGQQMLLPILDGLDEIPEAARRNAVRGLNEACRDGRGLVLTCRSAEYQDVIEGGSPALRRAPVVEVAPVPVEDAVAYLDDADWPDGVDWEPVYTHMREHPEAAVATALSTSLMLSLARTVYQHDDTAPSELLDFESRHAVEDHLVDRLIPASYALPPGYRTVRADGASQQDAHGQQEAARAEKYLTFLATYLHRHGERDLAWWRMSGRILSRWTGLLVGIGFGLLTMISVSVAQRIGEGNESLDDSVGFGVSVGVLVMLTWYAAPDRAPGRISFALRGSLQRLRGGFRIGFALASLLAITSFCVAVVITMVSQSLSVEKFIDLSRALATTTGAVLSLGIAFAIHQWLDTASENSAHATPMRLLRQDRISSLASSGVAGFVLGAILVPLIVVTESLAYVTFLALTHWSGEPRITDIASQASDKIGMYESPLTVLSATLLPGAVFSVLVLICRSWPRFLLLRAVLAARGLVPWRFTRFLTEAHGKQLLRQSGGTYQFRHIRLQERLASRSLARDSMPVPRARVIRRRRIQCAVTGVVLAACCLVTYLVVPYDPSRLTLPTGDVAAMTFSPDGTLVTARKNGLLQRWDTKTGKKIGEHKVDDSLIGYQDEYGWVDSAIESHGKETLIFQAAETQRDPSFVGPLLKRKIKFWRIKWDNRSSIEKELIVASRRNVRKELTNPEPGDHFRGISNSDGGSYPVVLWNTRAGDYFFDEKYFDTPFQVGENGATLTPGKDEDIFTTQKGNQRKECKVPSTGDVKVIDRRGKLLVGLDGSNALVWDEDCKERGVAKAYKSIKSVAVDSGGSAQTLALSFGGMTRIYDVSALSGVG
ncbi:NACHT domain-containing protein [Streptomyces sp. NPDC056347]|uniref:NACHT domain-containing protein n=1 Tax=Streptomyces sp. NPDC056347 TaxID=3345790 RepID=UPI0035D9048D